MKKPIYTIIKASGNAECYYDTNYISILDMVGRQYMRADGNWDRPNMLLMNGKTVVEYGLADLAWKYIDRYKELRNVMDETIKEEFKTAWYEEGAK